MEHAAALTRAIYRCYGWTYPGPALYFPDRIAAQIERGERIGEVAVTEEGRYLEDALHTRFKLFVARENQIFRAGQQQADGGAVQMDGTRTALREPAAELRAREADDVTNGPEQRHVGGDVDVVRLAVYGQSSHGQSVEQARTRGNEIR